MSKGIVREIIKNNLEKNNVLDLISKFKPSDSVMYKTTDKIDHERLIKKILIYGIDLKPKE
tara:strand:- start:554 stop:736 length:183 start_codon:yes stop_codon:yes gene_type:complete